MQSRLACREIGAIFKIVGRNRVAINEAWMELIV
jgi:hypothetical protein